MNDAKFQREIAEQINHNKYNTEKSSIEYQIDSAAELGKFFVTLKEGSISNEIKHTLEVFGYKVEVMEDPRDMGLKTINIYW